MSCFLKAENIIFLRWMTKKNLFFHTECKLFQWSSSDIGSSNGIGDCIWWQWIHWCTFPTTINDVHKHWVKLKSIVAISFMFRPISDVLPAAFPMHFNLNVLQPSSLVHGNMFPVSKQMSTHSTLSWAIKLKSYCSIEILNRSYKTSPLLRVAQDLLWLELSGQELWYIFHHTDINQHQIGRFRVVPIL